MFLKKLFDDPPRRNRHLLFAEGDEDGSAGGAGDAGGGDQSQQPLNDQSQESQSAGDPAQQAQNTQGNPPRRGSDWIPKHRFDQVNRGYQSYRQFGSPDEIRTKLETLQRLQQNPTNRYDPDKQREIREDFLALFPEMRSVVNSHQSQTRTFISTGVRQNDGFLKEINLEVNENNNRLLQDAISGIIQRDEELSARFFARDPTVFADGFRQFKKLMNISQKRTVPGLDATRNKTVSRAPARNGGGAPPQPKEIKPGPLFEREHLDQASEAAFARLSEQME